MLREATSISLALDECKYRKVLRYRCDLPSRRSSGTDSLWRHVGAGGFSHSGVLGIIHCKKSSASEFEEDHGLIVVRQLHTFFGKCCTPLGRIRGRRGVQPLACDYDLLAHIKKTVLCVAADGGAKERRAVFLAVGEILSNCLLVLRDPAHALRLATQSLHSDDVFGQVWHDLFDSRHALVPDLMNSDKWNKAFCGHSIGSPPGCC